MFAEDSAESKRKVSSKKSMCYALFQFVENPSVLCLEVVRDAELRKEALAEDRAVACRSDLLELAIDGLVGEENVGPWIPVQWNIAGQVSAQMMLWHPTNVYGNDASSHHGPSAPRHWSCSLVQRVLC